VEECLGGWRELAVRALVPDKLEAEVQIEITRRPELNAIGQRSDDEIRE
jgi:hypothetical protein